MIPLKITAHLQTPVMSDINLPIDGIMYNQFIRGIFGDKVITKPRQGDAAIYNGSFLPIERIMPDDEFWYYAASFAVWSPDTSRGAIEYAKRFDTHLAVDYIDFGKKNGKVDTKRGGFKNYFIKEYTFNAPYVEWYLRGNKEQIELLLPFCTHIGKKSSQGFGSVLKWEIEETERDWYKNDNAGRLMRAIPSNKGTCLYGIRPSYWHQRHQFLCVMPD